MKAKVLTLFLVAASLAGCAKQEPPACNDANVQATLTGLLQQTYEKEVAGVKDPSGKVMQATDIVAIAIELPVVVKYEKEIRLRQCVANVSIRALPGKLDALNALIDQTMPQGLDRLLGAQPPREVQAYLNEYGDEARRMDVFASSVEFSVQLEEGADDKFIVRAAPKVPARWLQMLGFGEARSRNLVATNQVSSSPATGASPGSAQVTGSKFESCGEEAVCLIGTDGKNYRTNGAALGEAGIKSLDSAATSRQTLCLQGITRNEDGTSDFESFKAGACS